MLDHLWQQGSIAVFCASCVGYLRYLLHQESRPPQFTPGSRFVDVRETATIRWTKLAAVSEQYAEHALLAVYGRDRIESLRAEVAASERVDEPLGVEESTPSTPVDPTVEPEPIHFKAWEPQSFADYTLHEDIMTFLAAMVTNMTVDRLMIKPQLFIGSAGRGKTTIVKVLAQEMRDRVHAVGRPTPHFIEAFGADLNTPDALDQKVRLAASREGSLLFIDEPHSMSQAAAERLYMLLDGDHRYKFVGDALPSELPDFSVVLATTDYGSLHGALKRRCQKRHIRAITADEIAGVLKFHPAQPTPEAVAHLVGRTHHSGGPWEALQVLEQAQELATAAGTPRVDADLIERVFTLQGIDGLGLYPEDRLVIGALFRCPETPKVTKGAQPVTFYRASESNVTGIAQVDPEEYRKEIRPRLMSRGLLITHPKQCLTPLAVARYGSQFNVPA